MPSGVFLKTFAVLINIDVRSGDVPFRCWGRLNHELRYSI